MVAPVRVRGASKEALRVRLAELERELGPRRSLAPGRDLATSLPDLLEACEPLGAEGRTALADGLSRVAAAVAEHFPENLFCDLDALAGSLARTARADPQAVAPRAAAVDAVFRRFGARGSIRFRYVHDFLYGFDWARWVRRHVRKRSSVGPYDLVFVERMRRRGLQLEESIARDDPIYGRLHGDGYRNPFRFSREPAEEAALLRAMAADDALPVEAHRLDGRVSFDRDFETLRLRYAAKLEAEGRRRSQEGA